MKPEKPYGGHPPFVAGCDTSEAAADSVEESAGAKRARALREVVYSGPRGCTCDEVEEGASMLHQTASARLRELVLMGFIYDSGTRRKTRGNRSARVYLADPRAVDRIQLSLFRDPR